MSDPSPEAGVSAPFWESANAGQLVLQRCAACERFVWYPRALCPHCGSGELTWTPSAVEADVVEVGQRMVWRPDPDGGKAFVFAPA
jgi:uncharacterized OB-fold protein